MTGTGCKEFRRQLWNAPSAKLVIAMEGASESANGIS